MKIRRLKHRPVVTPWIRWHATEGRRLVIAPLSRRCARSVR